MKRTEACKLFLQQAYEEHPFLTPLVPTLTILAVAL